MAPRLSTRHPAKTLLIMTLCAASYRVQLLWSPQRLSPTHLTFHLNMSTNIPRAFLQSLPVLRHSKGVSRAVPRCSRALHQRTTSTTFTASRTQVRPRIDLSNWKLKFQSSVLSGTIRTIFIQTENTPNADVSKRSYTTSISC